MLTPEEIKKIKESIARSRRLDMQTVCMKKEKAIKPDYNELGKRAMLGGR